jgi:hypothetical protein
MARVVKWVKAGGLLAGFWLVGGCGVPKATVDVRPLTGQPIPAGPMAMLPPVLMPSVQERMLAAILPEWLAESMRKAGLDVTYDTLDGQLRPRVLTTRPAGLAVTQPTAGGRVSAAERYGLLEQAGFRTAMQPVLLRYGYYRAYVPPMLVNVEPPGWGYVWDWGYGWEYDWDDWGPGGWGPYSGYYGTAVIPGHYESLAQVTLDLWIFDVQERRAICYIVARSESLHYRPGQLEQGFAEPLTRALRKAMRPAQD